MSQTHQGVKEIVYTCTRCKHQVTIYEKEEQAVYCRCDPDGYPMTPEYAQKEDNRDG